MTLVSVSNSLPITCFFFCTRYIYCLIAATFLELILSIALPSWRSAFQFQHEQLHPFSNRILEKMFVLLMFQCLLSYRKHFKMQQKECETFLENTRVKCKKKQKKNPPATLWVLFSSWVFVQTLRIWWKFCAKMNNKVWISKMKLLFARFFFPPNIKSNNFWRKNK